MKLFHFFVVGLCIMASVVVDFLTGADYLQKMRETDLNLKCTSVEQPQVP